MLLPAAAGLRPGPACPIGIPAELCFILTLNLCLYPASFRLSIVYTLGALAMSCGPPCSGYAATDREDTNDTRRCRRRACGSPNTCYTAPSEVYFMGGEGNIGESKEHSTIDMLLPTKTGPEKGTSTTDEHADIPDDAMVLPMDRVL